ncbi:MAG: NAD-dependent deacylase [Saprospiraceae bacterium]|jgi:NAD-dependent deacetylase|nr:NAD-dependent deacylase [Saprospiraceae bacterium]MBP6447653.1 NAD-dependent deacylase [Saprospiraceae bacterium]
MKKVVVLTGAGISAESGIKTFRDADGLWEGHDVMSVASPEGWERDMALVLDFYNQRRKQLKEVTPNAGHNALVDLEKKYEVVVITQNVDNLHEQAGSARIIHLHGELNKVRSTEVPDLIYEWNDDLHIGDHCERGYQLRPHIVWFGEMVPMLESAISECENGDIFIIIGTSMQVYPAASLISYAPRGSEIYYIDPKPHISYELSRLPGLQVIKQTGSIGVPSVVYELLDRR